MHIQFIVFFLFPTNFFHKTHYICSLNNVEGCVKHPNPQVASLKSNCHICVHHKLVYYSTLKPIPKTQRVEFHRSVLGPKPKYSKGRASLVWVAPRTMAIPCYQLLEECFTFTAAIILAYALTVTLLIMFTSSLLVWFLFADVIDESSSE